MNRVLVFSLLMLAGCSPQTAQQRADGYKRAVDASRGVCVVALLDRKAPTDGRTIARCGALLGADQ